MKETFLLLYLPSCIPSLLLRVMKSAGNFRKEKLSTSRPKEGEGRRDEGETFPISGAGEKSSAFTHRSSLRVVRPRLSGEKPRRMDFVLLSGPPWHLLETASPSPATVTCHFEVTSKWFLVRVKVWATREQSCSYVTMVRAFPLK